MEVVVALSIMLILIPLATPVYESYMKDLREQALRERLHEFRRALRIFYQDNLRYPYMIEDHFGNRVNVLQDDQSELVRGVHDGPGSYPANPRRYLQAIPEDPFSDRRDWKLIPAAPRAVLATSRTALPTTTSTRQLSAFRRAVTGETVGPVGVTGATTGPVANIEPVIRLQIIDIRSSTPGYEAF